MAAWIRYEDSSRIVMYEPASYKTWLDSIFKSTPAQQSPTNPLTVECESFHTDKPATDVFCPMYMRPDECIQALALQQKNERQPIILCEYSHAMGNSNGNLHKYWEMFRQQPQIQGGFIWDWVDQGIKLTCNSTGQCYWAYGGDFGDEIHDANFCINGLVLPDRKPKPGCLEARKLQQPMAMRIKNILAAGTTVPERSMVKIEMEVENRYIFISKLTDVLKLEWEVSLNGEVIAKGPLERAPSDSGSSEKIEMGMACFTAMNFTTSDEMWVTLNAMLKKDLPWAPRGFIVATEQERIDLHPALASLKKALKSPKQAGTVAVVEKESSIEVRASNAVVTFDKSNGDITGLQLGAFPLLQPATNLPDDESAPRKLFRLQFHRACTDNDNGGQSLQWDTAGLNAEPPLPDKYTVSWSTEVSASGTQLFKISSSFELVPKVQDKSLLALLACFLKFFKNNHQVELKLCGLERNQRAFVHKLAEVHRLVHENETDAEGENAVVRIWKPKLFLCTTDTVSLKLAKAPIQPLDMKGASIEVDAKLLIAEAENQEPSKFSCLVEWRVYPSGLIKLHCHVDMDENWPNLARVGCRLILPSRLQELTWLGLGPHESYPDRKASAQFGCFVSNVADQFELYIKPSENGNKTETRWAAFNDQISTGTGEVLLITSAAPFDFSALPYTVEDLHKASHTHELSSRDFVCVNLDHKLMGVGGDDSWTVCVHEEYLIPPKAYDFEFIFKGFQATTKSLPTEIQSEYSNIKGLVPYL